MDLCSSILDTAQIELANVQNGAVVCVCARCVLGAVHQGVLEKYCTGI
jgi:hypothetical protein